MMTRMESLSPKVSSPCKALVALRLGLVRNFPPFRLAKPAKV